MTSEEQARKHIDALLLAAGWHICDVADANIHAALGVAIREFPLDSGFVLPTICSTSMAKPVA